MFFRRYFAEVDREVEIEITNLRKEAIPVGDAELLTDFGDFLKLKTISGKKIEVGYLGAPDMKEKLFWDTEDVCTGEILCPRCGKEVTVRFWPKGHFLPWLMENNDEDYWEFNCSCGLW